MKEKIKTFFRLRPVAAPPDPSGTRQMSTESLVTIVAGYLDQGHTVTLPLKGNSMRPFLVHKRDKALLRLPIALRHGMVVLARTSSSRYVLHRIIAVSDEGITLQGDGNTSIEKCSASDIVAEAYGFIRNGNTQPVLTSSLRWRIYSFLWMRLRCVRRPLLMLHHVVFRSYKILEEEKNEVVRV